MLPPRSTEIPVFKYKLTMLLRDLYVIQIIPIILEQLKSKSNDPYSDWTVTP